MESQPSTSPEQPIDVSSPKKKRPKVTSFTVNEKFMVINTYKHIKENWPSDKYPYKTEMAHKTARILGIAISSVYRILKHYKENGYISSPVTTKSRPKFSNKIDDFTKSAIRKKVHAYFLKGELPTVNKVLNDVNKDDTLPNFKRTTFKKILKILKYPYIKRQIGKALIVRDVIVPNVAAK
ncbi:hypothetical protein evm_011949 [Chilo suppressalis]|nr:hypothetical protein evm_011949 [Chilo suppressalis]